MDLPPNLLKYTEHLKFASQIQNMDYNQEDYRQAEYRQELEKVQDRDFTHNWVSSSSFIFYLSVFCFLAFAFGSCFRLYNRRFENSRVKEPVVQESTMYTPKYSTGK